MTTRTISLIAVLFILAAGCSHKNPQADRIISSPEATGLATSSVETPKPTPTGTATGGGTAARTTAPSANVVGTPSADPNLAKARITTRKIATLDQPVAMAVRNGDPNIYFAEKTGRVRVYREGGITGTVLDISSQISTGGEQGLLGLTFSPGGTKMYVYFTDKNGSGAAGDDIVREYSFSNAHAISPRDVLRVPDPESNHNGGNIMFGPDGHLYIGLGDGGGAGDAHGTIGNAQDTNALLGKMLRIDPRPSGSSAYSIPSDNPFVGRSGRDEIWAYGLRNPWRWSFDRQTHDLWIGDVGQANWEEIDFQAGSSNGGDNYGWRRREGTHPYNGGTKPAGAIDPIFEYSHSDGRAVTGGFVYRGASVFNLQGAYVFADFYPGKLRAFVRRNGKVSGLRNLGPVIPNLSSFAEDRSGELYVLSLDGGVYKIVPG